MVGNVCGCGWCGGGGGGVWQGWSSGSAWDAPDDEDGLTSWSVAVFQSRGNDDRVLVGLVVSRIVAESSGGSTVVQRELGLFELEFVGGVGPKVAGCVRIGRRGKARSDGWTASRSS